MNFSLTSSASLSLIERYIHREYQFLLRGMKLWDKHFFRDCFSALCAKKTVFLGKLSHHRCRMEKIAERNTHFLLKESFSDFPARIEKRCFELVREQ